MTTAIIYRLKLNNSYPHSERTIILPPSLTVREMADYVHAAFDLEPGYGAFIEDEQDFRVDDIADTSFAGYFGSSLSNLENTVLYHPGNGCWPIEITRMATKRDYNGDFPHLVDALGPDVLHSALNAPYMSLLLEVVRMKMAGLELDRRQTNALKVNFPYASMEFALARLTEADEQSIMDRLLDVSGESYPSTNDGLEVDDPWVNNLINPPQIRAVPVEDNNVIPLRRINELIETPSHSGRRFIPDEDQVRLGNSIFFIEHLRFFRLPQQVNADGSYLDATIAKFQKFHENYPLRQVHVTPNGFDATTFQALSDFYVSIDVIRPNTKDGTMEITKKGHEFLGCAECSLDIILKNLPLHSSKGQRNELRRALVNCLEDPAEGRRLIAEIDERGTFSNIALFDAMGVFEFASYPDQVSGLSEHGELLIMDILDKVGTTIMAL